ncbi:MAG: prepilin-type N-terminal cleavage/methylation domain-containing protein [Bacteroidota bacterium]
MRAFLSRFLAPGASADTPTARRQRRDEGFSLTELLIVVVIVGILALLALPRFMSVTSRAKATEAKLALKQVHTLQQAYRLEHDRFSGELVAIGYDANELVSEDGTARYAVRVEDASEAGYVAIAEAVVDFDGDGTFDVWEVDESGTIRQRTAD